MIAFIGQSDTTARLANQLRILQICLVKHVGYVVVNYHLPVSF